MPPILPFLLYFYSCFPFLLYSIPPILPFLLYFHSSYTSIPPILPFLLYFHSSYTSIPPILPFLLYFHSSYTSIPPILPFLLYFHSSYTSIHPILPFILFFHSSYTSIPPIHTSIPPILPFFLYFHSSYILPFLLYILSFHTEVLARRESDAFHSSHVKPQRKYAVCEPIEDIKGSFTPFITLACIQMTYIYLPMKQNVTRGKGLCSTGCG